MPLYEVPIYAKFKRVVTVDAQTPEDAQELADDMPFRATPSDQRSSTRRLGNVLGMGEPQFFGELSSDEIEARAL